MAIYYRPPPPFVGGRQPYAPLESAPAPATPTTPVSYDAACRIEWATNLQADRAIPIDNKTSYPYLSLVDPFSSGFSSDFGGGSTTWVYDPQISIEFSVTRGVIGNAAIPLEWRSVAISDNPYLADWRSTALRDASNPIETTTNTQLDRISTAEWNLSFVVDRVMPSDILRSANASVSIPTEFSGSTSIVGDANVPLEWRSVALSDKPSLVAWQSVTLQDTPNQIENAASNKSDWAAPAEWSFSLVADRIVSTDTLRSASLSASIPSEFTGATGVIGDSSVPLDWRSATVFDTPSSADWRSVALRDTPNHVEANATTRSDLTSPAEWNFSLAADRLAPADILRSANGSWTHPLEYNGATGVVGDSSLPLEWRSVAISDTLSSTDWQSVALRDTPTQVEAGVTTRSNCILPSDWVMAAYADRIAVSDILLSAGVNASPPLEFGGATGVIGDATIPLDWRSVTVSDRLMFAETLSPVGVNVSLSPEFSGGTGITSDARFPLDWQATSSFDAVGHSEWRMAFQTNATSSLDFTQPVTLTQAHPVEWFRAIQSVFTAPSVWSISATASYALPTDWTSPTHQATQDAEISVEWNTHQDADASFSLIWSKPKRTKGAMVEVPSSSLLLAAPVAPAMKGGATASYVTVKSV